MNWEAIGAVGEVGGAIAVVATLVYLAAQIRHGTGAVLAANHEAMMGALRSMRHAIAQDSSLSELVVRGESAPSELSEVDLRRFEEFVVSQIEIWEQAFVYKLHGTLNDLLWEGWDLFGRNTFTTVGHREVWRRTADQFQENFRAYMEREVFTEKMPEVSTPKAGL